MSVNAVNLSYYQAFVQFTLPRNLQTVWRNLTRKQGFYEFQIIEDKHNGSNAYSGSGSVTRKETTPKKDSKQAE